MAKYILIFILVSISAIAIAQNEIISLNNENAYQYESNLYQQDQEANFHTGVKPYLKKDLSPFLDHQLPMHLAPAIATTKLRINAIPLIQLSGKSQINNSFQLNHNEGVYINANFGKLDNSKFGLTALYRFAHEPRFDFQDNSPYMRESVNGIGLDQGNNNAHHTEAYLTYSPNEYFSLTAGNGKHFWGDGYRSFMLSDNASPYPFFRIMSTFWNVRYTNLYSVHTDNHYNGFNRKFATSHQLSWNIVKGLNFTIFESVIFAGKDTLTNRGYDINYLNPIIFYRPVEYAQGSSDNVLFGASMRYTFLDKYIFYGQLVLDEFLLSAYRENNGWWANKFGIQIGFKTFDIANITGLSFQTELNFSRPYTYAHKTSLLNYAHLGQSLAHPLGANFYESVNRIRYSHNKWYLEAKVIWIERGENSTNENFGGDIFASYLNRNADYGNTIGQGDNHLIWWNEVKASYNLVPKINLKAFASYALRTDYNNGIQNTFHLVQVGIHTNMWNTYEDY